jgi:transcriptional regulator with XRE-family HTH domain
MDLKTYRERLGLTQQQVAQALALTGKSYISQLETGALEWPFRLALQVEEWSEGEVPALALLEDDDARLLQRAIDRAIARAASTPRPPAVLA